jgi:DAACS family dicarboxylate/amino acid:cation (Na+ or H+) symporter
MDETAPSAEAPKERKGLALHWQILIGLAAGAAGGLAASALWPAGTPEGADLRRAIDHWIRPAGQVFLRLIFMIVLPLIFSALVLGVAGLGDVRKLGRMGVRTLLFTLLLSSVSVVIGLGLVGFFRPGDRLPPEKRRELREYSEREGKSLKQVADAKRAKPLGHVIRDVVPENPLQEMVGALDGSSPGGGMLAVMFFALLVGIAVTLAPKRTGPFVGVLEGLYDVSMLIIGWAMKLAPFGVAALVFSLTAALGFDILKTLAFYVAIVIGGLALHCFGIYSFVVSGLGRRSPRAFFHDVSEAMLTAFGTSSSNATLPTSLRLAEEKLKLKPQVSRFVLTVGATANQNGTALYEGITVLFLAQVYGVDLTAFQQITVLLMAILAGIGTAGVPGGSLPLVGAVLVTIQVPAEGIAIILGVDRILDMCRTVVNVTGDLAVAACVDRAEGGGKDLKPEGAAV